MPASGPTDPAGSETGREGDAAALPEQELQQLESTIDQLLEQLRTLRSRADEAEKAHDELQRALSGLPGDGGEDSPPVEERLRRLSQENERLREIVDEGREHAERIRKRLVLLEDES